MATADPSLTPRQLVKLSLTGAYVVLLAAPLGYLQFRPLAGWVALVLCPIVAGIALAVWAARHIDRGVNADTWTREQLTEGYQVIRNRWATLAVGFLAITYLVYCFAYLMESRPHHMTNVGVFAVFLQAPAQAMGYLTRRLKPPAPPRSTGIVDWSSRPRIHSEHWGEPPASI